MQQPTTSTRKKFLLWGAALISSFTVLKIFISSKKPDTKARGIVTGKVKMLTQDGRLVEIDEKLLASSGKKVTSEELQQWIKK